MKALAILLVGVLWATGADAAAHRDRGEVRRFKQANACPYSKAEGCIVDHIVPLCAGGADKAANMQWQTKADSYRKDAQERKQCRANARSG